MPLILLCGGPCVGKTRRARDLYAYFQEQLANKENPSSWSSVHYINDESVLDKSTIYANPTEEKKVRATFMAAIERVLSPSTLVIADGMNYIKGYRYQLYCLVRSQQTTHCIVHCCTPIDTARQWHQGMNAYYGPATFEELMSRFEEPIAFNRWDSPLLNIMVNDVTPCEAIAQALVQKRILATNTANLPQHVAAVNYLYELDHITQDIVQTVMRAQQEGLQQISLPRCNGKLELPKTVTLSELVRHRRQFIHVNKMHAIHDLDKIAELFLDYLQTSIKP